MNERSEKTGSLRKIIKDLLLSDDFDAQSPEWSRIPPVKAVNLLLSHLYSMEEIVKWRAVEAVGVAAARLADEEMESARVIMRRLIWSLNDESGGIGWGAPEAMGEIMAVHERLADEYVAILMSYIRVDCNPLENGLLERGVLWGLGRLAQTRPHLLQPCACHFLPFLESPDPFHRAYAAWALGFLDVKGFRERLALVSNDDAEVPIFEGGKLTMRRVSQLARRAMEQSPEGEGPGTEAGRRAL